MKRQLEMMLAAVVLLCAPLAWSQSSGTSSSQAGNSSSSQSGNSGSSQTGYSSSSPTNPSSPSQPGSSISSPYLFTNSAPGAGLDAQNGSGDPTQSDSPQNGGSDTSQAGSTGPQDTFTHPEQLPALSVFSDTISHTGLSINTSVGVTAQHVTTAGYGGYWDTLNSIGAGISLAHFKPSYGYFLSYNGGTDITTGYSTNEWTLNQSANAGFNWNFAKRWQWKVRDSYFYSDNPFTPYLTFFGSPTPNNPNPVVYYPQAVVEENQGHMDLTYQLSAHDILNFGGSENFQRYLRGGATSLWNSVSYGGSAVYQHQINAKMAVGGGYSFSSLDFGHGQSRAGVQTFEGFISYLFSPKMQASLWIGPELTNTKDVVPVICDQFGCFLEVIHQSSWSVANGGTFKWKIHPNDELDVNGSRGVSNAGGILGAAYIYQVLVTYGRPINRIWNFGVGINYSNSNSVYSYRAPQYLRSFSGTVGVNRKLFNSDAWNLNAYFGWIKQEQNYFGPATSSTSGLGVTVRYVWDRGLGR